MSMLDDPALWVAKPVCKEALQTARVRFLPTSAFAAELGIPPGAEGDVRARYRQDGAERLNVQVTGGAYATGVPADEVAEIERRGEPDAR